MEIYEQFAKWLDNLLENNDMPDETAAYNFNIYDEEDETYGVQLIAAGEFSEDDDDWACEEVWSSEEDIFYIDHSDEEDADSARGLEYISGLVTDYLASGNYARILLASKAVGCGFIDGDIELLYREK